MRPIPGTSASPCKLGSVASVNVGKVRRFATGGHGKDEPFLSAYIKKPVAAVEISAFGLAGDEHGHPDVHGGLDRAVLMYPAAHYPAWRGEGHDFPHGGFGENLTVDGFAEPDVCIGDVLCVGQTALEVSVPRAPCWIIGARWDDSTLLKRVRDSARIGWLLRVIEQGRVKPGDSVRLASRPYPRLTVALTFAVYLRRNTGRETTAELAECTALSADWRAKMAARLDAGKSSR